MCEGGPLPLHALFAQALNGIELEYTQQELIDVILSVASGNTDTSSLLEWILNHEASEAR